MADDVIVAETRLKYKGEEVVISIYLPDLAFNESEQYSCRFSILGGELNYSGKSIGFDSMQSLILSLAKVGTYLKSSDEIDRSMIEWEGGPVEFPVFQNI